MMFFNHNILISIISLLFFVAVTTAASSCRETSYFGYNTDFVHIYNTKNGTESPGDTWTWHANVTSAGGESDGSGYNPDLLVGELVGYCIRTPGGFWECDETIIINGMGSLYVHYVQMPPATQSTAGILEEQIRTNQEFRVKLYLLHQVQTMVRGGLIWSYACLHLRLLHHL